MVSPYSMGVWGGVQSQVLGLARSMRRAGVDVQVLAPCDGMPPEPWITPLGNSMPYAQNGSFAPLAPDPAAQLRMLGAIRDQRFDLLHLHEPLAPGPTLTAVVVRPVPLVGTFHASGEIAVYRYLRPLLRRLTAKLDDRVAVSEHAAEMAKRHLGGTYDVLFNGIETDRFARSVGNVESSGPKRIQSVFFLARHEPRKGLAVLLDAARLLPGNVRVLIGGEGPESVSLRRRHADNHRLVWLGPLSDLDKTKHLTQADAFCVPSLGGESFGVVLLEGMAARVPVVASDLDAYRRTAQDGRDALLVPPGDAGALAAALRSVLDTKPGPTRTETERRLDSGQARAEEFSMDRLAAEYLQRYDKVLAASRRTVVSSPNLVRGSK